MNSLTLALILLVLALAGIVVRKTYFALPLRELKRRAAKHEASYRQLYRAAAYGSSLRALLWLYIGLTSAASFILLARQLPIWASLIVVGPLLWVAFSLLPATRTTKLGLYLTRAVTPFLAWLLNYLHPMLSRISVAIEQRYKTGHTRLFEPNDLLDLIKHQQQQPDNRFTDEELDIIRRVLKFNDHQIGDIMTPRGQVKTLLADDTVGPILIDEVHKSGQDFALVRESQKGDFVGSLAFQQLNLDSQGKVRDIMANRIHYLHESDNLGQALHAFFTTNQPLFIVVNSAEEYVGTLTIQAVLQQLLGHIPGEDFDQYADRTAVATRHNQSATEEASEDDSQETPVKTDEEVVESA